MTQEWTAFPVAPKDTTPEVLYNLSEKHRLIPENVADTVDYYIRVASDAKIVSIMDGDEKVGDLIFTGIVDGDSANLDFIPITKFFAPGQEYEESMRALVHPILTRLLEVRNLRRITAMVPESRCRTKKALRTCGFVVEGVMKDAVKFKGRRPENMTIMGMLPDKEKK